MWQGAVLMLVIGLLGGFMQVSVFTSIQHWSRPPCWAAAMSLFMFIFMGLAPIRRRHRLGDEERHADAVVCRQRRNAGAGRTGLVLTPMRRVTDAAPATR